MKYILAIIILFKGYYIRSQDTVYVTLDNTVYLTFPEKIELVDIGKHEEYAAEVLNENLVTIRALNIGSKTSTIMIKYGKNYKQFFLQVVPRATKFHYDFGINKKYVQTENPVIITKEKAIEKTEELEAEVELEDGKKPVPKDILKKCKKMIEIKNEESSLGIFSKFLEAGVTVIRNDKDNTYLKILINNKSTLPYKFDFISFQYFQSMKKGFGKQEKKAPQDVFPLLDNNNQVVPPLATSKVIYVIPSFALANDGYLLINFREKEGDRVLKIKIKSDKIQSAKLID